MIKTFIPPGWKNLWRWICLTHRWTGIALGILILLWFISGLVMVFVPRPVLSQAERLAGLPFLNAESIRITPFEAWKSLGRPGGPERVRLNASGGRPLFHFLDESRWFSVYADNGAAFVSPDEEGLRRVVLPHAGETPITGIVPLEYDQWTVAGNFNAWRPLARVELNDGRQYYVSTRTGEIVLDTAYGERAWNWLGSFAHWLYFTELRRNFFEAWRELVLWAAFLSGVAALSGFCLGIEHLRISKPYSGGRFSPYRDKWKLWHHWSGIAGGVFLLAWLVSGWLSLSPMGWAKTSPPTDAEGRYLAGGLLDAEALSWLPSLKGKTREIQWTRFDTQPVALLFDSEIPRHSVFDSNTRTEYTEKTLSLEAITSRARGLMPKNRLVAAEWLNEPDAYYYPRGGHAIRLPVARLRFDDAENTRYYIDPATGSIAAKIDNGARWQRWLYRGLHRFDFPPFDRHETARRVLVTLLSCLGIFLTLSACVLGWKRLQRFS
jgi:uncharacterized iron-regulated membrane protein